MKADGRWTSATILHQLAGIDLERIPDETTIFNLQALSVKGETPSKFSTMMPQGHQSKSHHPM
jgi:hypothetical protein